MKRFACRYAIIRFLPYPETGEFANIGIVLCCPATGFLGFKLQDRRYARITAFFEHLQGRIYTRAAAIMRQELARIEALVAAQAPASPGFVRQAFDALIHPREAMIRFSDPRALLAEDPAAAIVQLFGRHVEHDFAQKEQHEREMERRIADLLRALPLAAPFRPEEVGNDEIRARFPLVQSEDGRPVKVIKPLYLAQDEPNKIYDHGDRWIAKLRRLRRAFLLPEQVLLPLHAPTSEDTKRYHAYENVRDDLESVGALVSDLNDEASIVEFAAH
jgi:hypothetical protein